MMQHLLAALLEAPAPGEEGGAAAALRARVGRAAALCPAAALLAARLAAVWAARADADAPGGGRGGAPAINPGASAAAAYAKLAWEACVAAAAAPPSPRASPALGGIVASLRRDLLGAAGCASSLSALAAPHVRPGSPAALAAAAAAALLALPGGAGEQLLSARLADVAAAEALPGLLAHAARCGLAPALADAALRWFDAGAGDAASCARRHLGAAVLQRLLWLEWRPAGGASPAALLAHMVRHAERVPLMVACAEALHARPAGGPPPQGVGPLAAEAAAILCHRSGALPAHARCAERAGAALGALCAAEGEAAAEQAAAGCCALLLSLETPDHALAAATHALCAMTAGRADACPASARALQAAAARAPAVAWPALASLLRHGGAPAATRAALTELAARTVESGFCSGEGEETAVALALAAAQGGDSGQPSWLGACVTCLLLGDSPHALRVGAAVMRAATQAGAALAALGVSQAGAASWTGTGPLLLTILEAVADLLVTPLARGVTAPALAQARQAARPAAATMSLHARLAALLRAAGCPPPRLFASVSSAALDALLEGAVGGGVCGGGDSLSEAEVAALLCLEAASRAEARRACVQDAVPACAVDGPGQRPAAAVGTSALRSRLHSALALRLCIALPPPALEPHAQQALTKSAADVLALAGGALGSPGRRAASPAAGAPGPLQSPPPRRGRRASEVPLPSGAGEGHGSLADAVGAACVMTDAAPGTAIAPLPPATACRAAALRLLCASVGCAAARARAALASPLPGPSADGDALGALCAAAAPAQHAVAVMQSALNCSHPGTGAGAFSALRAVLPRAPVAACALLVAALMRGDLASPASPAAAAAAAAAAQLVPAYAELLELLLSSPAAAGEGVAAASRGPGEAAGRVAARLLLWALARGWPGQGADRDPRPAGAMLRLLLGDADAPGLLAPGELALRRPGASALAHLVSGESGGEECAEAEPEPQPLNALQLGALALAAASSAAHAACEEEEGGAAALCAAVEVDEGCCVRFGGDADARAAALTALMCHVTQCLRDHPAPRAGLGEWAGALDGCAAAVRRIATAHARSLADPQADPPTLMRHPAAASLYRDAAVRALAAAAAAALSCAAPLLAAQPLPRLQPEPAACADGAAVASPLFAAGEGQEELLPLTAVALHSAAIHLAAACARAGGAAEAVALHASACALAEGAACAARGWRAAWGPAAPPATADTGRLSAPAAALWRLGAGERAAAGASPHRRRKRSRGAPKGGRRLSAASSHGASAQRPPFSGAKAAKRLRSSTGHAYIDACGEHDDSWEDLRDFIVVKQGRDYGAVLARGGHQASAGGTARGKRQADADANEQESDEEEEEEEEQKPQE